MFIREREVKGRTDVNYYTARRLGDMACISGFATKTKILSEMALTIKSSALTGRIVPFFISSCSDRSSRLIANRKLGNKVL